MQKFHKVCSLGFSDILYMVADIQKEEKVAVFSFSRATLIISKEAPLWTF